MFQLPPNAKKHQLLQVQVLLLSILYNIEQCSNLKKPIKTSLGILGMTYI